MEEPGRLQSMGSLRVRQDWATPLSLFTFMHWRRKWQPTPVFLPGESQGRGSLVGCRLWGRRVGHDWSDLAAATGIEVRFCLPFSPSVMNDSLWPHGLQHARLPCPSPAPRACSNSCPSSQWCHPTSSSVIPFSSCLQSFPASGSFPVSQFFASGGQSIGVSASGSVLPLSIQFWFPLGLTGLISLQSKGLSRIFPTPQFKTNNSLVLSFLYSPSLTFIHDCWKKHSFD